MFNSPLFSRLVSYITIFKSMRITFNHLRRSSELWKLEAEEAETYKCRPIRQIRQN